MSLSLPLFMPFRTHHSSTFNYYQNAPVYMMTLIQIKHTFDTSIHLAYQEPKEIHTLAEIKLQNLPISNVASTDPFPFLSAEGVRALHRELFSKDVLDNCSFHTRPGSVQLRGMATQYAPFTDQFWTSLEVLGIVSNLAGVDLIPVLDHEICHTNVQLGSEGLDGVKTHR